MEHGPVLIVDDNEDLRELLQIVIAERGHAAITAENGADALHLLREGATPCLILLDLMMPVMDGFAFRQRQLADPAIADIPVIVFSGHFDADDAAKELKAVAAFHKAGDFRQLADLALKHCSAQIGH